VPAACLVLSAWCLEKSPVQAAQRQSKKSAAPPPVKKISPFRVNSHPSRLKNLFHPNPKSTLAQVAPLIDDIDEIIRLLTSIVKSSGE